LGKFEGGAELSMIEEKGKLCETFCRDCLQRVYEGIGSEGAILGDC